jgi:hypothetical protein
MASGGIGLGKEVVQGIFGGLIAIIICVAIGSAIAQSMSHGPKDNGAPAAAEAEAPAEVASPDGAVNPETNTAE